MLVIPLRAVALFLFALCGCAAQQDGKKPVPAPSATTPQSTNSAELETRAMPRSICEKRTYKLKRMLDGFYAPPGPTSKEEKGLWGSMQYLSPSGTEISVTRTDFKSVAAASKAFQTMVTGAKQVMERGPAKGHELPADSDRVLTRISHQDLAKRMSKE
jgi:hypothetical protein